MSKALPKRRLTILAVLIAVTLLPKSAEAKQPEMLRIKRIIRIDELGNARISLNIKASTKQYTQLKANTPNIALMLRRLGAGQHWAVMEDIQGKFNDNTSTIEIRYRHVNLARLVSDTRWVLRFEDDADVDLVTMMGTTAIFTATDVSELGLVRLIVEVHAPEKAKDLKLHKGPSRIEFELPSSHQDGTETQVDFELKVKPQIMTALAKLYGNPKFSNLWTARSRLTNTGDCTLRDFRVRFRVAEYSNWSGWKRVKRVLPKQQIVDVYFPVFDLDKLASLSGTRPVTLQVEYQYRNADGRIVEESDSHRTQILSRNEVLFSSFEAGEAVGFYDQFNLTPAVLASMVTTNDTVMQQVAGGVSKMSGGGAASSTDEAALNYMQALYNFMSDNRISYQTPPGYLVDGRHGQHVKYGRDVLRNRAGTCIDLAIFYASACEAVGLRPTLILIPGHCYPGVLLPSGRHFAVESTMIGRRTFREALEYGTKNLAKSLNGTSYVVNIPEMRNLGVHSLDLAKEKSTFLNDLGYRFTTPVNNGSGNRSNTANRQTNNTNNANGQPPVPQRMVGKWIFRGEINGNDVVAIFQIAANGDYAGYLKVTNSNGSTEERDSGRIRVQGNIMHVYVDGEEPLQRRFWFKNGLLWVNFAEIKYSLGFSPIK